MKTLFICCALCCFIAVLPLPIGYYTFLRTLSSIGAIAMIFWLSMHKNYNWIIVFTLVLILFNPIFPFHLYKKAIWIPLDIATGCLFLLFPFLNKKQALKNKETVTQASPQKIYTRDRIILSKKPTSKDNL